MTILVPMRPEVYSDYVKSAIASYADDILASGRLPFNEAVERARMDFEGRLPQGVATPDNYLFEIKVAEHGPTAGFLWFCIEEQQGIQAAFVCDIMIQPDWRRKGYATRAFEIMESKINTLGITRVELHVFGHNAAAQSFYAKLGYGVTSIYMLKKLGE